MADSALDTLAGGLGDQFTNLMRQSSAATEPEYGKITEAQRKYAQTAGDLGVQKAELEARGARGAAGSQMAVYKKFEPELMAPAPTIQYSPETQQSMMSLATLLPLAGMMMGGAGRLSGIGAMQAMSGILEGHRQGNQDRIALETKNFEQKMSEWKTHQEQIKGAFERALKMASINASAAQAQLKVDLAKLDAKLLMADVDKHGVTDPALRNIDSANKFINFAQQELTKMFSKNPIKGQFEGKTVWLDPTTKQPLRDIEGNIVLAEQKGSAQQEAIMQRTLNSLGGAASAVEGLMELPSGTTTGALPNLTTQDGLINYFRNEMGRKMTSREADNMNTLFAGLGRNLASIEASGTATGLKALSDSLQSGVFINAGADDPYKVALKMADIRRIAEENITPAINAKRFTPEQEKEAVRLLNRLRESVPFTVVDVIKAGNTAEALEMGEDVETLGEATKSAVGTPGAAPATYKTVDDVAAAYKSGKIDVTTAKKILKDSFGVQ